MRMFEDLQGRLWDVAVAQESYGSLVLVFAERSGAEIRKSQLGASTQIEAEAELGTMSEDALRARLADAPRWEP